MRIINWNINKGGIKVSEIVEVLIGSKSDVIVLPEYRKDNPAIGNKLKEQGFNQHIPDEYYESGNQVAVFTRKELDFSTVNIKVPGLNGLVVFAQNKEFTICGVFFPKKLKNEPSVRTFIEWIEEDSIGLSENPTILTGDFNHGVKAGDWNKNKHGDEYKILRNWLDKGVWSDCCPIPDPTDKIYQWTYYRSSNRISKNKGGEWPQRSSRPDHFFVSQQVKSGEVKVIDGQVANGLSDHEPMICEFF